MQFLRRFGWRLHNNVLVRFHNLIGALSGLRFLSYGLLKFWFVWREISFMLVVIFRKKLLVCESIGVGGQLIHHFLGLWRPVQHVFFSTWFCLCKLVHWVVHVMWCFYYFLLDLYWCSCYLFRMLTIFWCGLIANILCCK